MLQHDVLFIGRYANMVRDPSYYPSYLQYKKMFCFKQNETLLVRTYLACSPG